MGFILILLLESKDDVNLTHTLTQNILISIGYIMVEDHDPLGVPGTVKILELQMFTWAAL